MSTVWYGMNSPTDAAITMSRQHMQGVQCALLHHIISANPGVRHPFLWAGEILYSSTFPCPVFGLLYRLRMIFSYSYRSWEHHDTATIDPWSPAYLRRQTGLGLCLDVMLWSARSGKMAQWVDLWHLTRNLLWFGIRHRAHARLSPQKFCRRCFLQMAVDYGCSPENGKLDGFSLECTSNSI